MSGLARAGALALVLAAASSCAGGDGGDGGEACSISLVASPPAPVRGQFVSVTAMTEVVGTSGARSYTWLVSRSEEHTSELQSRENLVCRLLLEKKNQRHNQK